MIFSFAQVDGYSLGIWVVGIRVGSSRVLTTGQIPQARAPDCANQRHSARIEQRGSVWASSLTGTSAARRSGRLHFPSAHCAQAHC